MSEETQVDTQEDFKAPLAVGVVGLLLAVVALRSMGRVWWCQQGDYLPWAFDVWSAHNSQHLLDPYTFTHVLHGVFFYGLMRLVLGKRWKGWRLAATVVLESAWEVAENTTAVIEKYRESTISLDYNGDSIFNSLADVGACVTGYFITASIPVAGSVAFFLITELVLMAWIRDSLILNVIMLTFPIEAIKTWQSGGTPPG